MECLEWSEEFSVGVEQMDEEHIALFAIFNDICAAVEEGRPSKETEALLRILLNQTREHFASEERLLASSGFPGFTEHADHHRQLNTLLNKYIQHFDRRDAGGAENLLSFLRQWLTGHIRHEDQSYGAWLNSQPSLKEPGRRRVNSPSPAP